MSDTLCNEDSGEFQDVRLQSVKNANGMQIEVKPRRRRIRSGIHIVQKDDWVLKVSHLNTTRFDIFRELPEQVYEQTFFKSLDSRKEDLKICERNLRLRSYIQN